MNKLFDNTEKIVKFNRSLSQQLQIKYVLNPYTQSFIDVQHAIKLGILHNGHYRNNSGDLIPFHIAASQGLIEFIINDQLDYEEMEIEYHSKSCPIITNLRIDQVYDQYKQCMITFRQAINSGYLDTELFLYSCSNISMSIHEAFYHGYILGELCTNMNKQILSSQEILHNTNNFEYENLFTILTNIMNSLNEFINTINIIDDCQLTIDGYIQHKTTGKCYLLTQAMELDFISFQEDVR
ncbi:unnamed protein product [Adineta steineri]|uniref:Uncharacterized protein n=2 Tax=Adineta steineri TaxID=433720 RepID=A0A818I9F9_9BILA|nr:unnamed protein product [Adineta steineri]CAF3517199.1 unnamed protein product [Adineta steineri]